MVYPIGVLTVAGGVITLLLWKVVRFSRLCFLASALSSLATKIVIQLSNFVGSYFV